MQLSVAKPHVSSLQSCKSNHSPITCSRPIHSFTRTFSHPISLESLVPSTSLCLRRSSPVVLRAQSTATEKLQPDWANKDTLLSKFVNFLIDTKPIYAVMKVLAKQALKNSAEERGIRWDGHAKKLMQDAELKQIKEEIEKKDMVYPSYYLQPFHAYEEGNLNWLAACEVEPATYATAIRTFKDEPELSALEAFHKLRTCITSAIKDYHAQHGLPAPTSIVDMGCSVGMSSRWLAQEFPEAKVTGADLSPYFLAVAELEERKHMREGGQRRVHYMHDKAESSVLDSHSVDLLSYQFVIHECTQAAITSFIKESARLIRPGGVLCIVDNNPRSPTIQNLPPPIYTLMKSTEPWSDQYYSFDVEQCMREHGFGEIVTVATDHRHRAVMGILAKPKL